MPIAQIARAVAAQRDDPDNTLRSRDVMACLEHAVGARVLLVAAQVVGRRRPGAGGARLLDPRV